MRTVLSKALTGWAGIPVRGIAAVFALGLIGSVGAHAATLFDSTGSSSVGVDPVAAGPLYASFSTGGSASTLTQVGLMLASNPDSLGTFSVSLWSDNGNLSAPLPQGLLLSFGIFNDSGIGSGVALHTFAASYALTANTRYWIEVSGASSATTWSWTDTASGPGVATEYWFWQALSPVAVPNVGIVYDDNNFWNPVPYQMIVEADSPSNVPVPAALPLFLGGIATIGLIAARRRKKVA